VHFNQLFPSKYVSAADLASGPVVLRIAGVRQEQMNDGEVKPVVAFHGGKPMVLNRTNGEMLHSLYGSDVTKWINQPIELYATTTQFGFKTVECVRLRPPPGARATTPRFTPMGPPDTLVDVPGEPEVMDDADAAEPSL
jgi:hypothetical protein